MKEKIAKLINVKSIVTIILTVVIAYLAVIGKVDVKEIYLIIISFYFGTQHEKKGIENAEHKQ